MGLSRKHVHYKLAFQGSHTYIPRTQVWHCALLFRLTDLGFGGGRSSQPGADSAALSSSSSEDPAHFFQIKEFPNDIRISVNPFWSKYVLIWLLPWYKWLYLASCFDSKYFEQKKPPLPCSLPPPTRTGWVNNSKAAKICRKRNWSLMRLACVKPIFKW